MKKYIVIDLKTHKSLYGLEGKTIVFSTDIAADEFGRQRCNLYLVVEINF